MGFALKMQREEKGAIAASRAARRFPARDRRASGTPAARFRGGQRQRVALGRAIVRSPQAFLMDEPLSNLDAKLRVEMRAYIARLHQELGTTTLYVTHDQTEAMTMGDRVAVMRDGRLEQVDSPQRLYEQPENMFVAGFIGSPSMNLLRGSIDDDGIDLGGQRVRLPASHHAPRRRGRRHPARGARAGQRPRRRRRARAARRAERDARLRRPAAPALAGDVGAHRRHARHRGRPRRRRAALRRPRAAALPPQAGRARAAAAGHGPRSTSSTRRRSR